MVLLSVSIIVYLIAKNEICNIPTPYDQVAVIPDPNKQSLWFINCYLIPVVDKCGWRPTEN